MDTIRQMLNIIKQQFTAIMSSDPDYYKNFNIILSNEQQYIKDKDRNINNVYIVVKFLSGSLNYGQTLLPVNFNALGQGNKIDVCQRLLLEYAQTYNLGEEITINSTDSGDGHSYIIKQVYNPPQVMNNFNESWDNFRSLFYMAGTFLIGKDSMPITEVEYFANAEDETGTKISFVSSTWDLSIQLDSQAFYGTNSMTDSKSKIGTLTINITAYLVNNGLFNKIRAIGFRDTVNAPNGIKEEFYLKITFADGYVSSVIPFHIANATTVQNIGEFPLTSMTFTN